MAAGSVLLMTAPLQRTHTTRWGLFCLFCWGVVWFYIYIFLNWLHLGLQIKLEWKARSKNKRNLKLTIKPTASNVSAIHFFSNLSLLPVLIQSHKNLISAHAHSCFHANFSHWCSVTRQQDAHHQMLLLQRWSVLKLSDFRDIARSRLSSLRK